MNDKEVISAFADLCGMRDLDPVTTLWSLLNAQDWHPRLTRKKMSPCQLWSPSPEEPED